ncbi:hypothetical protein KP509_02G111200 [Ceratopteris richardii]|uniref:Indole-3-acetic acid-amido synthetase GH3.5 n=1 Tax=Ceratopteris richardii TaxID=49495 RepID=A0A8T2VD84_CERRI|nr:hypothetical protein KP509_02G111200 [Ceratopteris richardii]
MPGPLLSSQPDLVIEAFEDMTSHADEVQNSLLVSILQTNASSEYLKQFPCLQSQLLDNPKDTSAIMNAFTQTLPLVTHADIRHYLQRIANGERSAILTAEPIRALCLSSGTTEAKEKYLPYHDGLKQGTLEIARIAGAFRSRVYPTTRGARILEFLFCGKLRTTCGGVKVGTATTHMIRDNAFSQRQSGYNLAPCSPLDVVLGSDCHQVMYCHLLLGLLHCETVEVVSAPFAYTIVEALRSLQADWKTLCHDLRTGTINRAKVKDEALHASVDRAFTANPTLSDSLFAKFESLSTTGWGGVIQLLWPRCKYVLSIMTGAMEAYVEKLSHFAGQKLPLVSADYAATEGWIGANIDPRSSPPSSVSFTVLPNLAYFEFIPLKRSSIGTHTHSSSAAYEEGNPVRMIDVKIGQEYEIVMTTHWGLYRYRLGDVVRVTGFYNKVPQLAYVCRKNVLLNINIDKVTETDLKAAVNAAAMRLGEATGEAIKVVDYTSYADKRVAPGHYVIFWELDLDVNKWNERCRLQACAGAESISEGHIVSESELLRHLADCATTIDNAFVEPGYVTSRKMNTIGALELRVVMRGTFAVLLERFLSRGAAITQYKTPRCTISPDSLAILRDGTYISLFSRATF